MEIEFFQLKDNELGPAFEAYKSYLRPVIESVFGWDEEFQKNRFKSRFQSEWFNWVLLDGSKAGLVCYREKQDSVHVHLLIIFSHFQRQGLGSLVTQKLQADARGQNLVLTLSCFKNNEPALSLYRKLGFQVKSEDEHFYDFTSHIETV